MRTWAKITASLLLLCTSAFSQRAVFHAQNVTTSGGGGTVVFHNTNTMQHVAASSVTDSTNMAVTSGCTPNCMAFVVVAYDHSATESITAITLGGTNILSNVACGPAGPGAQNANIQVFYLAAPSSGTLPLAITGNANVNELYYNVVSFTGVNQSTPVRAGTCQTLTNQGSPASIVITSNANDLTLSAINTADNGPTTNQTLDGSNAAGSYAAGHDHATTAASSVTSTWTGSAGSGSILGFSIQHS